MGLQLTLMHINATQTVEVYCRGLHERSWGTRDESAEWRSFDDGVGEEPRQVKVRKIHTFMLFAFSCVCVTSAKDCCLERSGSRFTVRNALDGVYFVNVSTGLLYRSLA